MFNKSFEGTAGGGEYQRIKSRLLGLLALNLSHGDVQLLVGGGKSQIMQISWGKRTTGVGQILKELQFVYVQHSFLKGTASRVFHWSVVLIKSRAIFLSSRCSL